MSVWLYTNSLLGCDVVKFAWDKQLDFDQAKLMIESEIEKARLLAPKDAKSRARLASLSVMLVQQLNGSRVSEAYDAVLGWSGDGVREQKVVVRKHRRRCLCNHSYRKHLLVGKERAECRSEGCGCIGYTPDPKDVELRLMIVPPFVRQEDREFVRMALKNKTTIDAVIEFSRRNMAFNTHSLRYAFISKQARDNVPAQTVAKMTHHKKLDYIIDYTQQQVADDVLRQEIET